MVKKLCLIGKYPPIQGGVSRMTFWMTRALADAGIEVHVITNADEVEDDFRIFDLSLYSSEPYFTIAPSENLFIHKTDIDNDQFHIPWVNPVVTKLSSKATEIVSSHHCDLIHAFYLEPYGVAAFLASKWTQIPYGLQHAGSDIGRLYSNVQMTQTYKHIIKMADYLVLSPQFQRLASHCSGDLGRLYPLPAPPPPSQFFNPEAVPLNIDEFLSILKETFRHSSTLADVFAPIADKTFNADIPTIGIYGKIGEGKGWRELLPALTILKKTGANFNFVALGQGRRKSVANFLSEVRAHNLLDRTYLLPFIPHWHVPHFINSCNLICELEHGFPIKFHTPSLPQEVVECGTCLLMSKEVAGKNLLDGKIRNGRNCFVADPADLNSLVSILTFAINNVDRTYEIGLQGRNDFSMQEDMDTFGVKLCTQFIKIQKETQERKWLNRFRTGFELLNYLIINYSNRPHIIDSTITELENTFKKERSVHIFRHVQKVYKFSYRIFNENLRTCFYEFYEGFKEANKTSDIDIVAQFGDFLLENPKSLVPILDYTPDILSYEIHFFKSLHGGCSSRRRPVINSEIKHDDQPIVTSNIVFVNVKHNVPEIIESLQNFTECPDYPPAHPFFVGNAWLAFKPVYIDELDPEVVFFPEETKLVIDFCDGTNSVYEILRKVLRKVDRDVNENDIFDILNRLMVNDWLELPTRKEIA
jgi:glycosyltransferase involved in cell wall biosynthesis